MILTENNNANIHHIPTINVVITDGDTKVLNGIQDNILLNTINKQQQQHHRLRTTI